MGIWRVNEIFSGKVRGIWYRGLGLLTTKISTIAAHIGYFIYHKREDKNR
jgi:hypothetical protein